ncbi:MAG: hypothetical protein CO093_07380 [Alphaproteobacteria bacterium CG_4_9_14_3_um_filter_47_13]|nr:MAG: hypothetical protein CO093_07380 [Alphaproteobacteria bacterium CG_4_9_14_3_um_filter_47_13]
MKIFSLSTLAIITGAVAAGALLFWTSQTVQQAEDKLSRLQKAVENEKQSIRVLHAEWDYLNRPVRLESLAAEYLDLSPVSSRSMHWEVESLPDRLPPALVGVNSVPEAQPVTLPLSSSPSFIPVPRMKPSREKKQDFQTLLQSLDKKGGVP